LVLIGGISVVALNNWVKTTPPTIKPKKHSRRPTKTCYRWRPRRRDLGSGARGLSLPEQADGYAVYTNMVPGAGFRGYGSSQTIFAIEDLGKKLGLDPFELRRRNMIRA
jgi:hypothetical protein